MHKLNNVHRKSRKIKRNPCTCAENIGVERPGKALLRPRSVRSRPVRRSGAEDDRKPKKRYRVCFFCCGRLYYISFLFLRNPERWLSGRRRRSRKPLTGYSRSGVRIPLSPPFYTLGPVDHSGKNSISPVSERSRTLPHWRRCLPHFPFSPFVTGAFCVRRTPEAGCRHAQHPAEGHAREQDQRQVQERHAVAHLKMHERVGGPSHA